MLRPLIHLSAISIGCVLMAMAPVAGRASELILANGDHLTGTVVKQGDGAITFHSDVLGDVVISATSATVVEPTAAPAAGAKPAASATPGSAAAGTASAATKAPSAAVAATPLAHAWTGKVEFGYDNAAINAVRTVNVALRAQAERTINEDNFLLKGEYLYGSSSGLETADETNDDFRWRHNLSQRLFTQTDTSYDSNRMQQVEYQLEQTSGLGYKIFNTPQQTVDVGGGVTGEDLDAIGVQKGFTYLGNAFQDYNFKINSRYTLHEDSSVDYSPENRELSGVLPGTITPTASNTENYSYKFDTGLESKINQHLSLNLHFQYQYDNAVLDPSARTEQRITTTLGYGF